MVAVALKPETTKGEFKTDVAFEKSSLSGLGISTSRARERFRRPPTRQRLAKLSNVSVDEYKRFKIIAIDSSGKRVIINAIAPLTKGVAIDVPLKAL
jgi:hypothetical protein